MRLTLRPALLSILLLVGSVNAQSLRGLSGRELDESESTLPAEDKIDLAFGEELSNFKFNDDLYDMGCVNAEQANVREGRRRLEEENNMNIEGNLCSTKGLASVLGGALAGQIPGVGGIAKGIVPFVMDGIYSSCPSGGPPSYFTEVYAMIERIIGDALEQHEKDKIGSQINNLMYNYMEYVYYPRKKCSDLTNPATRKELSTMLQAYDVGTFLSGPGGMLQYLTEKPTLGLDVWMIGTGLRLVLMQELAMVDPDLSSPEEWCKSSYGRPVDGSIVKIAENAAKFVPDAFKGIIDNYNGFTYEHGRNSGRDWRPVFIVDPNAEEAHAPYHQPFLSCSVMPNSKWKDCCNHFGNCLDRYNSPVPIYNECESPQYAYCGDPRYVRQQPNGKVQKAHNYWWEAGTQNYIHNIVNASMAEMLDLKNVTDSYQILIENAVPTLPCEL
jgi:hypothetical protein